MSSPPPPKKNSNALLIIGIIGAVFVGLIIVGSIGSHDKKQTPAVSAPSTPRMTSDVPAIPSSKPSATPPPIASIGQEARDGQFAFTVTSVDRSKIAGDLSNQFEIVTAQGEFLNVHVTVANTGNQAQTFFATNQKLKISGRVYEANSSAALWTQALNVTINPGNSIQVVVSFDVPPEPMAGRYSYTTRCSQVASRWRCPSKDGTASGFGRERVQRRDDFAVVTASDLVRWELSMPTR